MNKWIPASKLKDTTEPVVYLKINGEKNHVGIAYWSVSGNWIPSLGSRKAVDFDYFMNLPDLEEIEADD